MPRRTFYRYQIALCALALSLSAESACKQSDSVLATSSVLNRGQSLALSGRMLELDGSFGPGCVQRSGAWSVAVASLSQASQPALTVLSGNSACSLTLDSIRIGDSETNVTTYLADQPISLAAGFQLAGAAFRDAPGEPVAFYANARLLPDAAFGSDFTVQLIYSNAADLVDASSAEIYAMSSAGVGATGVPPPDYSVATSGLDLRVDAHSVVIAAAGGLIMLDGAISGDSFVVTSMPLADDATYAMIDAAYISGQASAIVGPDPTVPAALLGLGGLSLMQPVTRHILVARTVAGVRSYQHIAIVFMMP